MNTTILTPNMSNLRLCAKALALGSLVAFPTETVYGLGGNAYDSSAASKIYAAKGRPSDNPLIVHVDSAAAMSVLAEEVPEAAKKLAEKFMPGPLTIVLKKKSIIPDAVTGGLSTVAIRVPSHPVAHKLLAEVKLPICAPSANTSGCPSPTTAKHVLGDLGGKIPYILDGGDSEIGLESTVVDLTGKTARLLRPGAISAEQLRETLGEIEIVTDSSVALCPGMKYKHYAPSAEVLFSAYYPSMSVRICEMYDELKKRGKNPVILCLSENIEKYEGRNFIDMGGSYEDYAHNLFAALRKVDDDGYDVAIAEGVEASGIGGALINRLIKSSGGRII